MMKRKNFFMTNDFEKNNVKKQRKIISYRL